MFGSTRYQMIKEMTVEEMANCLAQNSVGCPAVARQDCEASRARTAKGQFTFCARCWLDFLNEEVYWAETNRPTAEVRTTEYPKPKGGACALNDRNI